MKRQRGFTLIELMVVVIVISVLATIALGAYNKQVRKSRRAEAKQSISDYALRQEKFRSNHPTYTVTLSELLEGGSAPTLTYYNAVAISTPGGTCADAGPTAATIGNSFQISASAKGDQAKDTACTPMVLVSLCGQVTKTPAGCW